MPLEGSPLSITNEELLNGVSRLPDAQAPVPNRLDGGIPAEAVGRFQQAKENDVLVLSVLNLQELLGDVLSKLSADPRPRR